ncbi:MAG: PIN domain-containing protein [Gammaproteobacteria bacterium]|nr:PIN domain-containing protein [Gammaproteobacteria bacterium]
MRAVDTNVLVRLLVRDDAAQVAAAEAFVARGAWVSQLVLAEAVWVLQSAHDLKPAQVATAVEMLLTHDRLSLQDEAVVSAALDAFRGNTRVEFTDCLVLEIARKAGHLPLGTFDRRLGRLEGAEDL